MIVEKLLEVAAKEYKPAVKKFHRMSEIGKCCRAITYDWLGYEKKPIDGRGMMVLDDGNLHHRDIRERLRRAGYEITHEEMELYDEKWNLSGHIDGIISGNGLAKSLLEIKSINRFGYERIAKTPLVEHVQQVNLYLFYFPEKIEQAILLYKCKDTSRLKDYIIERDDDLIQSLLEKIDKIDRLVAQKRLADPEFIKGIDWQCDYCQFEEHCAGKEIGVIKEVDNLGMDKLIHNYINLQKEYLASKKKFEAIKSDLRDRLRKYGPYHSKKYFAELKERKMPIMIKDPEGRVRFDEIIHVKEV